MTTRRIYDCACGYEKHVQGTTRGEIVCDLCGAEIDESMLREVQEAAPASSAASEPPTSAVPSHVRAAFEEPKAAPSPAPKVRPASSAEDRTSTMPADPPMSSFDELEPVATPPAAPGTVCTRCNRPFKGDWDRVEGAEGVICYNCSNMASVGTPERLQEQEASARPFPVRPEARAVRAEKTGGPTFLGLDTQNRYFQGALWLAAIATIVLSVYLVSTGTDAPPPSSSEAGTAATEVIVPEGFELVYRIWPLVQVYLAGFIALYLVLRTTGQLPHDNVFRDVVFLGLLVAGLTVIYGMLWFPADVLISGYALYHFLRLRFTDIVIAFIVYGLMKFLLSQLWIVAAAAWFGAVN